MQANNKDKDKETLFVEWKSITNVLNSFYRQVPIGRDSDTAGFPGHVHLVSVKTMYNLLLASLGQRHLEVTEQSFTDYGCGEGYILLPFSLVPFSTIIGIEHNRLVLQAVSTVSTKLKLKFPQVERILYAYNDLEKLVSLGTVTIAYLFNYVFPTSLNLHLFKLLYSCSSVHTIFVSHRSLQRIWQMRYSFPGEESLIYFWKQLASISKSFNLIYGKSSKCKMYLIERKVEQINILPTVYPLFENVRDSAKATPYSRRMRKGTSEVVDEVGVTLIRNLRF